MGDLSCCPEQGGGGWGPFGVTLRVLLAQWPLRRGTSTLPKGKEGEGTGIWGAGAGLWTQT